MIPERDIAGVRCGFFMREVEDKAATRAEGRPIVRSVPFARIQQVGDNKSIFVVRADEAYQLDRELGRLVSAREIWPREFDAFMANLDEEAVVGTPVAALGITAARAEEMRRVGVRTVEDLANISGSHVRSLGMDGDNLRQRAKDFLAAAAEAGVAADLREKLAALEARVAGMSGVVEAEAEPEPSDLPPAIERMTDGALRAMLEAAGVVVDGRWGRSTLQKRAADLQRGRGATGAEAA
ncbi:MAG: hypothetical protein AAFR28_03605 [Pseudomonadota bacterium]